MLVQAVEPPLQLHDAFRGMAAGLALKAVLSPSSRAGFQGEQQKQAGGQGQHGANPASTAAAIITAAAVSPTAT